MTNKNISCIILKVPYGTQDYKVHWKVNNERKEKPSEKENNKSYEKYETITMS